MLSRVVAYGVFSFSVSMLFSAGCQHDARGVASPSGSCPDQRRNWSADELAEIAVGEVGGSDHYAIDRVTTRQEGCKIFVMVTWKPRAPGGHFTAVVSAIDGSVLEVIGGL
jgi:hypothetical protein